MERVQLQRVFHSHLQERWTGLISSVHDKGAQPHTPHFLHYSLYKHIYKHTTFCMKRVWQESIYITVGQILLGYTQCHCTFLHSNNWHDTITSTVHITLQRKWLLVFSPSQSCIRDTAWVPKQVTSFRNEEWVNEVGRERIHNLLEVIVIGKTGKEVR